LFDQAHASQTEKVIRDTIVKTVPDTANKPKQTIDWRKRRAEHDSEVNAAAQQSIKNIQEQEKVDSARAVPDTAGKQ
jgi:hypothetical protein